MIVVYSKADCVQCLQAERLLVSKSKQFEVKKLDTDYTREDIFAMFEKQNVPQPRSFPIITNEDKIIGGLTELKMAVAKGTL